MRIKGVVYILIPISFSLRDKPLNRSSIHRKHLQRAVGGGIMALGTLVNGPMRASRNAKSRQDVTARYSRKCMLVHD